MNGIRMVNTHGITPFGRSLAPLGRFMRISNAYPIHIFGYEMSFSDLCQVHVRCDI